MRKRNEYETRQTLTNGGKAFNVLLVNEKDPVQYLDIGYEIVKSQYEGQGRFPYN